MSTQPQPGYLLVASKFHLIAACMMHVEGFYSTKSLAFRSNNPGNIEAPTGLIKSFPSIIAGYDALVQDIAVNFGKPLATFLAKYAPPSENNTSSYIQIVSELTGIKPTDPI